MKLLKLTLKHFKGIKNFTLDTNGKNVSVMADNGVGKTTLFDAFTWLLFNKDSNDRADFEVKTLDCNNNPIHNLEHEVSAVVELGGKQVELRKIYKEKWTKKRGQAETEFSGHETEYFVDEVPRKKKEYEDFISGIAAEKIFKLVTNPLYFNSVLHWKERREIMLSICGDVTNEEVFAANKDIEYLKELLDDKSTEDALKMLVAKRKKINDELKEIPTRISEVSNMLPELPHNVDFAMIEVEKVNAMAEILALESQIEEIQKNIEADRSIIYEEINKKQKMLLELKSKKSENELQQKTNEQTRLATLSLIEAKKQIIDRNIKAIAEFEGTILVCKSKVEEYREEYLEADSEEFTLDDSDECCRACGQILPEKLRGQKIATLKVKFEKEKNERLESIAKKGKSLNENIELYQKNISNYLDQNKVILEDIAKIEDKSIVSVIVETIDLSTEIDSLSNEIFELKSQVEKINYDDCVTDHKGHIEKRRTKLEEINKTLSLKEVYENSQKRIAELEQQEKHLSSVFVELEKQIYGVEQFIKTRVDLLECKLNSLFDGVKFKLFSEQINGGLTETFETLINGVPYSDANGAAKINSGIEIINRLCEYYQITAPIFVDNAESVVNLQSTNSQVIRLVVSEGDKALRVVSDNELRQTA